jgi:hypothetical protein
MHARGPAGFASAKIVASEAWQEPLRTDGGQLKHRRFIWATQFGTGSSGSGGGTTNINKALAENANAAIRARNEANRERNRNPSKIIYPGPSSKSAEWWAKAS